MAVAVAVGQSDSQVSVTLSQPSGAFKKGRAIAILTVITNASDRTFFASKRGSQFFIRDSNGANVSDSFLLYASTSPTEQVISNGRFNIGSHSSLRHIRVMPLNASGLPTGKYKVGMKMTTENGSSIQSNLINIEVAPTD